ncbi:MAG: hypothetical protein SWK76_12335 [Actinomycetota bacterium]|nr:hypothetical protein [Actinomycetota bacterium]
MDSTLVSICRVNNDPVRAMREVFDCFGETRSRLCGCDTVFIKINAV